MRDLLLLLSPIVAVAYFIVRPDHFMVLLVRAARTFQ